MRGGDAEQGAKRGIPITTGIEAEGKLIEIGLEMLRVEAMVSAHGPDFEVGEDAVDPGCDHCVGDMAIVAGGRSTTVAGNSVGLGRGAGREVGGKEGVQTVG